jgi:VWFA-related protein
MRTFFIVAVIAAASATVIGQRPVFRAQTELVSISASVKRGNTPVAHLTAADFALFDNDVPQKIDALTLESVPVDVTLFMDTSHSTVGAQDRMRRDLQQMIAMLGPEDRFRLLTIGLSVEMPIPWRSGGRSVVPEVRSVPGISLVYDALAVALTHTPDPDRRHLVIAMTDAEDCGSVVDGRQVLEMSARSESVLHWVRVSNPGGVLEFGVPAWCTPMDGLETDYVSQAARRSGGDVHGSALGFGTSTVRIFRDLLGEFRQSYVLRYSPQGVTQGGWHQVRVTVPSHPNYKVRFRSGYDAGQ